LLVFPDFIREPIRLIAYLAIFYPVFWAALRVKKNLGSEIRQTGAPQLAEKEHSP
jgi:hypothetical protein